MAFLPCTLVAAPWSHRLFQRTWCRTCCLYRPGWWSSLLLRIIAIEFANRFVKPRRLGLRWIASRWVPALNQEKLEQYQNVLSVITLNTIFVKICKLIINAINASSGNTEYMTAVLARVHSSLLSEELTSTGETDRFAGGHIMEKVGRVKVFKKRP